MTDPSPDDGPAESTSQEPKSGEPKRAATSAQAPDTNRRGALTMLVGLGSVAYAGALAVPGYAFLTSSGESGGAASWKRVAELAKLTEGVPTRALVIGDSRDAFTISRDQRLGSVWLVREGESVHALSAECPHLGCAIAVEGDGKSFGCPCHTSRFALDGHAESGPSPRGMDELAVRVVDGWVEVEFRRFKQGVPDRVEVG